jgi:uncharacterized protein (DUF697 family)
MTTNSTSVSISEPQAQAQQAQINARVERANAVIRKYVLLSMGAGAIPVPVFDVAASVGLQLKLIQEISEIYGVDHCQDLVRNAVATITTTTGGLVIGSYLGASVAKFVPGVGTKIGIVKTAMFFGITTHISGKFLIMHFEAGGTLLEFDPIAMRNFFKDEFEKSAYGRRVATDKPF